MVYDGSSVTEIPCDVADYVFSDMNANARSKVWGFHNSEHGEVWWFFASGGSTEIDRYVSFDYKEQHWNIGELSRSCGVDQGVWRKPLMNEPINILYEHEVTGASHGTDRTESAPLVWTQASR